MQPIPARRSLLTSAPSVQWTTCLCFVVLSIACGDDPTPELDSSTPRDAQSDGASPDVRDDTSGVGDAQVIPLDVPETDTGSAGVPALVAIGALGRTLLSCDDGHTWRHDTNFASAGDDVFCGEVQDLNCQNTTPARWTDGESCVDHDDWNCDHNPGSSMGLAFQNGRFVSLFGWGAWGTARTSEDGVNWTVTRSDRSTYNRLHRLSDRLFSTSTRPVVSRDSGETWQPTDSQPDFGDGVYNVRAQGVLPSPSGGERVWLLGRDGGIGIAYSDDGGSTWVNPTLPPDACTSGNMLGLFGEGGRVHLLSRDGDCVSEDQGGTWSHQTWADAGSESTPTRAHQVNGSILAVGNGDILRNTDGTWERFDQPNRWPTNEFFLDDHWIALRGNSYDSVTLLRSRDGIEWIEDTEALVPLGPPIRQMVQGTVPASSCE